MAGPARRFEARDYVRIIRKRLWLIMAIGAVAMLLGGIYAASYPTTYRASAVVWVRRQAPQFFWATGQQAPAGGTSLETQATLAGSNDNAKKTAERLAARTAGGPIIASPTEIASSITVRVQGSDRIRITAEYLRKDYAIAFANETAETFVETSSDLRRGEDRAVVDFLEDQLEVARQDLDQALGEKQQLQKKWEVTGSKAGEKLLASLDQYKNALSTTKGDLAAIEARIAALDKEYAATKNPAAQQLPIVNPVRTGLQQEWVTTRLALVKLQARYTADHPAVQQLQAQVDELNSQIQQEPTTISAPLGAERLAQIRGQLDAARLQATDLRARTGILRDLIGTIRHQSLDLIDKEGDLAQLEYKATLARSTFEGLLQGLRDSKLKEAAKGGTAQILSRAIGAQVMKPNVSRALIFSGMLGLFAGIMLALLLEVLDDTLRTPDDIQRDTEVAFLGIVPWSEPDTAGLVTLTTPKSPPAEAFRTLRSNINFALVDQPAKNFLVTSAGAGEGKSLTAANLAVVFAQADQSVIVVDSDLRRPLLHRLFDCDSSRGLTNILVGEMALSDALQETGVDNLRLITSGPLPPNPAELLDSAAMTNLINELGQQADLILYDSPPAIMLTDAVILSSKIERTILVAEAGQVTRDAFNEVVRLIALARGNILGAILNKVKVTAGDYYYYYYYYYYGRDRGQEESPSVQSPIPSLQADDADAQNP